MQEAPWRTPLATAFVSAGVEMGYENIDFNSHQQTGKSAVPPPTRLHPRDERRDGRSDGRNGDTTPLTAGLSGTEAERSAAAN